MHENLYKTIKDFSWGNTNKNIFMFRDNSERKFLGKTNTYNWTVAEWMSVSLMPESTVR